MTVLTTSFGLDLGPIDPDWTIGELLAWLEDDARTHDSSLREPLARIEAAVTGTPWPTAPSPVAPSTVALIRSLAVASRSGGLSRVRIAHFAPNPAGMEQSARLETSQVA
ncbi:hypothetical protein [Microbacterium sp. LCT-H2]|uniref:hypothetical protein n=1 Tax=Microbacterium sp. LCT-H2 TaxID=1914306 RepID=UPI0008F4D4B9|nr:hypothetical protein [Microbacterium sp. LCT-H2]OIJ32314.1 hypothetical protein BK819_11085 [Microbacterium sp. LCT-H2]